jgi:hypothetical protein
MILIVSLWLALGVPSPADAPKSKFDEVTLRGTVVELTDVLRADGLPADADIVSRQVVLKADDGVITPLLPDETSRALFVDERLRNRKSEIHVRRYEGLPYVQVTSFRVEDHGTLRTPEYYCDVCSISVRYPQTCPCCQGPMVFRMKPEAP